MKKMKIYILSVIVILASAMIVCYDTPRDNTNDPKSGIKNWPVYNLGDTGPAGGWIFYINSNAYTDGWKYLEAAPTSQAMSPWSTQLTSSLGTSTDIGTGKSNTATIVTAVNGASETDTAAQVCDNYTNLYNGTTWDDWFLPSRDETQQMFNNLHKKGLGNFTESTYYWTSSDNGILAWQLNFFSGGTGDPAQNNKIGLNWVRPARRF
jgi:hypothetical protein